MNDVALSRSDGAAWGPVVVAIMELTLVIVVRVSHFSLGASVRVRRPGSAGRIRVNGFSNLKARSASII